MDVTSTAIPDVKIVKPKRFGDHRGFFSETFSTRSFAEAGLPSVFVQDNHSLSRPKGTVRGLHFQLAPFAQDKLVRVVRGAILDIAVDLRRDSPSFGRWVAAVLSAENGDQLLIPIGFAHAFCTLEADTEVLYKVTNFYSPQHDRGLLWNDPDLAIDWPVSEADAVLSDKDRVHPRLRDLPPCF
ncbi:MAG TPA: dTDP-4-dehydrorhamnose 3,5-epimerase [Rhodospirillaceae bacterium]|nr:dTDP-4-dehydrorhamnose 3,5-epimerase [Rhodospirillaceae bacterium]